jgi:hypothetical protein
MTATAGVPPSPRMLNGEIGYRVCPVKASFRFSGFTARLNPSSRRLGDRAKSNWSSKAASNLATVVRTIMYRRSADVHETDLPAEPENVCSSG